MAFPSDSADYTHYGPASDPTAASQVSIGATIGGAVNEMQGLLTNAHRGYTMGHRATLLSLGAWGDSDAQQPFATTTNTSTWDTVAVVHYPFALDRPDASVIVDVEDCEVKLTIVRQDTAATVYSNSTSIGSGRNVIDALTITGTFPSVGTVCLLTLEIQAVTGTGKLYSLRIYEDETST